MELNRFRFVCCFGIALLLMAGVAMAGTTTFTATKFARELGAVNAQFTMPNLPSSEVFHAMDVIRTAEDDFFVDVTVTGGTIVGGPSVDDMQLVDTVTELPLPFATFSLPFGVGTNTVRFYCELSAPMTTAGTIVLHTAGWTIKDTGNAVGTEGGKIQITVATVDAATNAGFDQSASDKVDFIVGAFGVASTVITPTTATIDVVQSRKKFVVVGSDTLTEDKGATLGINRGVSEVYRYNGTPYSLTADSVVKLVITSPDGDLSGITSITWAGIAGVKAGNIYTITVLGDNATALSGSAQPFVITVNGTTVLNRRHLNVEASVTYAAADAAATFTPNPRVLRSGELSNWGMNGTVLFSTFQNGNWDFFKSRLYIYNPSAVDGLVTVEVFSMGPGFPGDIAQSTLVGTLEMGTLKAHSGVNIRLAEDVLQELGSTSPYVTDNGNLMVQVTVNAAGCIGSSQVYNNAGTLAFGTNPMAVIQ